MVDGAWGVVLGGSLGLLFKSLRTNKKKVYVCLMKY